LKKNGEIIVCQHIAVDLESGGNSARTRLA